MPFFVDGHLDLAFNAVAQGRDLTREVDDLRASEKRSSQEIMVTLPELRRGGVGLVFGTLFVVPHGVVRPKGAPPISVRHRDLMYETPDQAMRLAEAQLAIYEMWEGEGRISIIRSRADLEEHVGRWSAGLRTTGVIVLMEGADPIRSPEEVDRWFDRGVRLIGPAWQRTRYAGGTHAPGPLTAAGRELVAAIREADIILDASHLAEDSFWDAIEAGAGPLVATHSNARAITPTDRHLTDAMIAEIGRRDGVVGVVLGNEFVKAGVRRSDPKESVTLADVRKQAEHIAALIGWERVGIGSDFDGGFGLQETPLEITRGADFERLGAIAPPAERAGVLGENWLRFLRKALPAA